MVTAKSIYMVSLPCSVISYVIHLIDFGRESYSAVIWEITFYESYLLAHEDSGRTTWTTLGNRWTSLFWDHVWYGMLLSYQTYCIFGKKLLVYFGFISWTFSSLSNNPRCIPMYPVQNDNWRGLIVFSCSRSFPCPPLPREPTMDFSLRVRTSH